jgi:hypothetical protein
MKKCILPVLLVLLFAAPFGGSVLAQPRLSVPDPDFNFGFVPQHSKISHIFWLHSTGTDTLNIKDVKPG